MYGQIAHNRMSVCACVRFFWQCSAQTISLTDVIISRGPKERNNTKLIYQHRESLLKCWKSPFFTFNVLSFCVLHPKSNPPFHSIPFSQSFIPLPFISINNGVRHYTIIFPYRYVSFSSSALSVLWCQAHLNIRKSTTNPIQAKSSRWLFYYCGLPYKPKLLKALAH